MPILHCRPNFFEDWRRIEDTHNRPRAKRTKRGAGAHSLAQGIVVGKRHRSAWKGKTRENQRWWAWKALWALKRRRASGSVAIYLQAGASEYPDLSARTKDISDYFCADTTKPIPPTPSLGAFRTGFDAAARLHRSVRVKRLAKDASHSYGYSPVCRNSLSAAAGMDGNALSDYPKPVRPC